jgi:hypothetical protein
MNKMERLDEWLALARSEVGRRLPDPLVEQRLLDRVRERRALQSVADARQPPRARPAPHRVRPRFWFGLSAALASAALAGVALLVWTFSPPVETTEPRLTATPFFALVAADAIAAERSPIVVESTLPRVTLADYGLPVDPARVDEAVGAEFLLSRAGVVLAVRFKE